MGLSFGSPHQKFISILKTCWFWILLNPTPSFALAVQNHSFSQMNTKKLLLTVTSFAAVLFLLQFMFPTYAFLVVDEDGLLQSATVLFYLVAGIRLLFFKPIFPNKPLNSLVAIGCIVLALEELRWGIYLFDISPVYYHEHKIDAFHDLFYIVYAEGSKLIGRKGLLVLALVVGFPFMIVVTKIIARYRAFYGQQLIILLVVFFLLLIAGILDLEMFESKDLFRAIEEIMEFSASFFLLLLSFAKFNFQTDRKRAVGYS